MLPVKDRRVGEIGAVFERFILQPEDVELCDSPISIGPIYRFNDSTVQRAAKLQCLDATPFPPSSDNIPIKQHRLSLSAWGFGREGENASCGAGRPYSKRRVV